MSDLREYQVIGKTQAHLRRVEQARRVVCQALDDERPIVSSSWGKDSSALLGLCFSSGATALDVVHLRSPYELPGNEIVRSWAASNGATIYTVPTKKTLDEYIAWLQQHGLHYERDALQSQGKKSKRDDLVSWLQSRGYGAQLMGMRADESAGRRRNFRVRGLIYPAHGMRVANPLAWWSVKDVWAYLVTNEIPWHPLYDCETHGETRETLRNSGWLSVHSSNDARIPWLRRHYPEQYSLLRGAFPQISAIG